MEQQHFIRRAPDGIGGYSDAEIRRLFREGALRRVAPGRYAQAAAWDDSAQRERHVLRVLATAERTAEGLVFSHHSAAALWGFDLLGDWPDRVHVTIDRRTGGRSTGLIRRHTTDLRSVRVTSSRGVRVTTPSQTAVDLARLLPVADGVVVMDSALRIDLPASGRADAAHIGELVETLRGRPGVARAARVASFADGRAESPLESLSRVVIDRLGFPPPVLQHSIPRIGGGSWPVDFYWPGYDHVGECDGRGKYRDPRMLRGADPADAVIAEKNRENEIRRRVRAFSRWEYADVARPERLLRILSDAGLPRGRQFQQMAPAAGGAIS